VLKGIFGPNAHEVRGVEKFYDEEYVTFIPSPNIFRVIKIKDAKMESTCSFHREHEKFR
jgi:hypothetical protein